MIGAAHMTTEATTPVVVIVGTAAIVLVVVVMVVVFTAITAATSCGGVDLPRVNADLSFIENTEKCQSTSDVLAIAFLTSTNYCSEFRGSKHYIVV